MVRKVTDALDELFIKQGLSLVESLEVMASYRKDRKLCKIAGFLLEGLRRGDDFSNVLKECPYLKCDSVFLAFILLAEKSGNLMETIAFLKKRCDRKYQGQMKIVEAAVYPLFVIVLAVGVGAFLLKYCGGGLDGTFGIGVLALCFVSAVVFFVGRGILKEDRLAEAFFAVDFLVKSGHSVSAAVGFAAQVAGVNSKLGELFLEAKSRLEFGMGLSDALMLKGRLSEMLYFAERGAAKSDVFEKLAVWKNNLLEKRRRICMSLIEPVFISLAGIYMLMMIVYIFMPFMNDMSWL
ncbi:MAG: type II secretion system F family protein [Treponema sp.]|nr:type II secretion system F family protein [Treponema sp.]